MNLGLDKGAIHDPLGWPDEDGVPSFPVDWGCDHLEPCEAWNALNTLPRKS